MTARIDSITFKPANLPDKPDNHFSRQPAQQVMLVLGWGIEGDSKGGRKRRQINLMQRETLEQLAHQGYDITAGAMGEQLVVAGLDDDVLQPDTLLQIGEQARVRIVQLRNGCKRLVAIQGQPVSVSAGRLGVLVDVVQPGPIAVDDAVRVITFSNGENK